MDRLLVLTLVCLMLSGCEDTSNLGARQVSMVTLITTPRKAEGNRIQVIGYLQVPDLRLFLTEDHAKEVDVASSVVVRDLSPDGSLIRSTCAGGYVKIVGRFSEGELFPEWVSKDGETCWRRDK